MIVSRIFLSSTGMFEHSSHELWGRCPLLLLRGVDVAAYLQPRSDKRAQVRRSREVQGTGPDTAPKRRSQVACGLAQSTRNHCVVTSPRRSVIGFPVGCRIEVEK
jgi:hypothetical protein